MKHPRFSVLPFLFIFYIFLLTLYTVFSFSLTDPNLVLSTWAPYWNFQQWMWQTFFLHAQVLTQSYIFLISALGIVYCGILFTIKKSKLQFSHTYILFGAVAVLPLLFSYNALSHDIFNYLFNAKMIIVYHANPHISVALNFPNDTWLRFMHNVHTAAPYGYGWTAISLIPFILGFGKFLSAWFAFRFFSMVSIFLLFFSLRFVERQLKIRSSLLGYAALFLNPLFLIEVVSNTHNDLWMMAPALFAFGFLFKKTNLKSLFFSALLLAFSISTKFSTVLLLPLWFVFIPQNFFLKKFTQRHWASIAAILLFLPLLSLQSQQFQPWYLIWSFVWLPLIKIRSIKVILVFLSFTSLLRYVPWLLYGSFTPEIVLQQRLVTWVPTIMFEGFLLFFQGINVLKHRKQL